MFIQDGRLPLFTASHSGVHIPRGLRAAFEPRPRTSGLILRLNANPGTKPPGAPGAFQGQANDRHCTPAACPIWDPLRAPRFRGAPPARDPRAVIGSPFHRCPDRRRSSILVVDGARLPFIHLGSHNPPTRPNLRTMYSTNFFGDGGSTPRKRALDANGSCSCTTGFTSHVRRTRNQPTIVEG